MRLLAVLATLVAVAGCASEPPVSLEGVDRKLVPRQVLDDFDSVRGDRVAWGGVIVATDNLADYTRIEVLSYPLNYSNARPRTENAAQGRFVIHQQGYLESVDFAPGRAVTVSGTLTEVESGTIGEKEYLYPVVRADELHLWKTESNQQPGNVHFGIGIVITN